MRDTPTAILVVMALAACLLATPSAQTATRVPHDFLVEYGRYTDDDLRRLDAGESGARSIDTGVGEEVGIIGTVRVRATTDFFYRMYQDIERFETGWGVTRAVSDPPMLSDWDDLVLPAEYVEEIRTCRVGDCDFPVADATIDAVQALDWNAADASERFNQLMRRRAHDFVVAYTQGGNQTLGETRNRKRPKLIAEQFTALLENSPYLLLYRPELHRYLDNHTTATLPGSVDFLYWSMFELGPKPVLKLNHVTVYPTEEGPNPSVIIASKQLYFSHYFYTGLELQILTRDAEHPEDGFYLTSLTRYRSDQLGGMFGGLVKRTAVGAVRDSLGVYLRRIKSATERYYAAEQQAR